jgi:AraC family transcriptional regulator, dual regulator of chb operon
MESMKSVRLRLAALVNPGDQYHYAQALIRHAQPERMHWHDFHEIFWVLDGRGWHWINGEKRELTPGLLVLVRAPDVHAFSCDKGVLHFSNLAFFTPTWQYLRKRYFDAAADFFGPGHTSKREFHLSPSELADLKMASRELEVRSRPRMNLERFLLNLLAQRALNAAPGQASTLPDWLVEACREIREEKRFVDGTHEFAKLCHRTPEHVAREVRRHFGKTPTDIVNEARMEYAATRLSGSNDKIIHISLECGFENLSHFYGVFTKQFGISPRQYRLQQRRIISPSDRA